MTPDMAFECLLVSRDPQLLCTLNHALDNLSIYTKICLSPTKALYALGEGSTDLFVIDWDDDLADSQLLREIQAHDVIRRQTVVAVSQHDRRIPGAHFLLQKPLTAMSGTEFMKRVYIRMLRDHRRHARYAVMASVIATDSQNRLVPITITNIGDGGLGMTTREKVAVGEILCFRLLLPLARRPIYIEARILWTREYGACGGEFLRIPPVDLDILHEWLKAKCQVKKPVVNV